MEPKLGVIAGSGGFPVHVCREAQRAGYACVVAGIKGETEPDLQGIAGNIAWFEIHEIGRVIDFFKKNAVTEAVFAGKIDHRAVYRSENLKKILPDLLGEGKDWTPTTLIQTAILAFSSQGIAIKDPSPYIASAFCEEGFLTETKPSPQMEEEILFGWNIAKKLADLDIGQTVIIKGRAIVAVEGMEGTDDAIIRAGDLAGAGVVAVKVSRTAQDPRIDLPAIGLQTVRSLVRAGGSGLAFEAHKIPFFQKNEALSLADKHGVFILAK
jgi:DUF1009 family protein